MDATIWDEPIVQDSPKRTERVRAADEDGDEEGVPHRPLKRARQTLFYADCDDDLEPGPSNARTGTVMAPPPQDIDIDALFEDVDVDDDESRPLPSIVNEEELTRQAEARYRKNAAPLLTPHEILPSSSPSRDTGEKAGNKGPQEDQRGGENKARRRQLRLDENLLLNPNGFPQLIKMTKDFRIKGKGREAEDLDRLLRIYQYWTHQLYPKTTFSDTIERIERLCHSRRMNVALSVWRDEAQGKVVKHIEINSDDDGDDEGSQKREKNKSTEAGDRGVGPPSSPPHSSPSRPTSPLVRQNTLGSPRRSQQVADSRTNDMFQDDDDEFWKNLDMGMDTSLSDVPSAPPTTGPNSVMDEDEDMWNIIDEIEKVPDNTIAVAAGPQPENQPPNDDWDDMYV